MQLVSISVYMCFFIGSLPHTIKEMKVKVYIHHRNAYRVGRPKKNAACLFNTVGCMRVCVCLWAID